VHRFTTERLLIRPLSNQDKELYISLYCDAKVMRNIAEPLSIETAKKAFDNTLKAMEKPQSKIMTWAIVTLADNKTIGIQGLTWPSIKCAVSTNEKTTTADIGIMLATKANGQLFPEEAMGALMEYGFTYLDLEKISAFYANKNLATKRFVKKLGFTNNRALQDGHTINCYQHVDKRSWKKINL
jgi:RimJ/RimL family protein N-acetyltransferase